MIPLRLRPGRRHQPGPRHKRFVDEVAKLSDGKLKVRAFGAASLGSDAQMQNALIGGAQGK